MVRPWVMADAIIDFVIVIANTFGAEFPNGPFGAVLVVEKFDQSFGRVAVGALGIGGGRS